MIIIIIIIVTRFKNEVKRKKCKKKGGGLLGRGERQPSFPFFIFILKKFNSTFFQALATAHGAPFTATAAGAPSAPSGPPLTTKDSVTAPIPPPSPCHFSGTVPLSTPAVGAPLSEGTQPLEVRSGP